MYTTPFNARRAIISIHLTQSRFFTSSFDHAERAFYISLNAVFASEEVVIQLVTHKCLPILTYGNEVCP